MMKIGRVEAVWNISDEVGLKPSINVNTANPHYLVRTVEEIGPVRKVNFLNDTSDFPDRADAILKDGRPVFHYTTPTRGLTELLKSHNDTGCFLLKKDLSIWRLIGIDFFMGGEPAEGTVERFALPSQDPIESARRLLAEGYKDPAAQMAGVALEAHLRALCDKRGIDTTVNLKPKKAEAMNTDLANAGVYLLGVQKKVTAWLDLRNSAAHGLFASYSRDDVKALILEVSTFRGSFPK